MKHKIELTDPQINYLLTLIGRNIDKGEYWGNKEQFEKRRDNILRELGENPEKFKENL